MSACKQAMAMSGNDNEKSNNQFMGNMKSRKKTRTWVARIFGGIVILFGMLFSTAMMDGCEAMGRAPSKNRLSMMKKSPNYLDGKFVNTLPAEEPELWKSLGKWIRGNANASPDSELPYVKRKGEDFEKTTEGLRVTWFGHSSTLVEIEGHRLLIDPVFGERSSPFSFIGPKKFHPSPISIKDLPLPDAVVISHDHYDHLDKDTVVALAERNARFIVPLGVGSHLEYWGVAPEKIEELDWFDEVRVGDLTLIATPGRHFSGRSMVMADRNKTLWSGWAIVGKEHRVYYSGDTSMFPGFKEIGEKYGPFDITMIEVGAYHELWRDLHLGPEQAVEAHLQLKGRVLLPVHWGTFNLALHSWTEPGERVLAAAKKMGVAIALPKPGESVVPENVHAPVKWWPNVPWKTAQEEPLVSSGFEQ